MAEEPPQEQTTAPQAQDSDSDKEPDNDNNDDNDQDKNELPLDWTELGVGADEALPLRYPHDVAEIFVDDVDICVVGTAGQKITVMGRDFSSKCDPHLKTLVLRSHLIKTMQGLESFKELDLLELYDNMVQALECLEACGPTLRVLDMSYNVIRHMTPVAICENLQELCKKRDIYGYIYIYLYIYIYGYVGVQRMEWNVLTLHLSSFSSAIVTTTTDLANNKLKEIKGLGGLTKLKKIDLGANRIRVMEESELSGLVNLEELWLGKNKIVEIGGLEKVCAYSMGVFVFWRLRGSTAYSVSYRSIPSIILLIFYSIIIVGEIAAARCAKQSIDQS
jgi:Leucine-rich repeat (LRR) protein